MSRTDAARRKQLQRDRMRALGLVKVELWVAEEQAETLKEFGRSLPPPSAPKDARQLDWIDAELASMGSVGDFDEVEAPEIPGDRWKSQGSLF